MAAEGGHRSIAAIGATPAAAQDQLNGLALGRAFFSDVVKPLVTQALGHDRYAAARLDSGSEVLGYDTPISRDHGWGPRVTIFVDASEARIAELRGAIDNGLPPDFLGYSTAFHQTDGTSTRYTHGVVVTSVDAFLSEYLGISHTPPLSHAEWLGIPSHRLHTVAVGPIFHDGAGALTAARAALAWYPDDLWLHLLATQWRRIAEEESFAARCGDVGDDLGSRLVTARQAVEMTRLGFLIERVYPPYFKWYGTAFARLEIGKAATGAVIDALQSNTWEEREAAIGRAAVIVAERHNRLGVTPALDTRLRLFHERPYHVLDAERFAEALEAHATPAIRALPRGVGAIWQCCDATALFEQPEMSHALASEIIPI